MLVPTPYSIANRDTDPYDVFEEIFPQYIDPDDPSAGEHPYWQQKREAMWARFHDTGIGNTDEDYWIRCMKSKAMELEYRYLIKFEAFDALMSKILGDGVSFESSQLESSSVNRLFDPPEVTAYVPNSTPPVPTVAEDYLSEQNRTDFSQRAMSGLETETVKQYMDGVENPFEIYAREFDRLFYWGM